MPRGDRTGPEGTGSKTGRALGYCAGFDTPGYRQAGFGVTGFGARVGMGRRHMGGHRAGGQRFQRRRYFSHPRDYLEYLKGEIKATEQRLADTEWI